MSMRLEELNRHFDLLQQRAQAAEMLATLRSRAEPGAKVLTGMPHTPGVCDRVGDLASEIADCQSVIDQLDEQIREGEIPIGDFIEKIPDLQTRAIFRLRFLRGMSWKEVSQILGWYTTESGVKAVCYRYFRRYKE